MFSKSSCLFILLIAFLDYDFVFVEPVTTDSDIGFPATPDENVERGQHERGFPFYGAEHEGAASRRHPAGAGLQGGWPRYL